MNRDSSEEEAGVERTALRERHTELTRAAILEALVAIVNEGGLPGFSVQDVADRAGVSHRTVYRHFPSREALLAGLVERSEELMAAAGGIMAVTPTVDDIGSAVRQNFVVFDEVADLLEAAVRFSVGAKLRSERRDARTAAFLEAATCDLPGAEPEQVRALGALIRLLASSRAWLVLQEDSGLTGEAAGRAVEWAVTTLVEAARAGRAPAVEDGEEAS